MNQLYRLVTEQSGRTHVSSVILTQGEAVEALATEILMHKITDWDVALMLADKISDCVITCQRGNTTRVLSVIETNPMEEVQI